jgi:hypothetical protein
VNTLVYRYGLLAPIEGAKIVEHQMRAAHDLRNDLTRIECGRREAIRASTCAADVEALEREVATLRKAEAEATRAIKATRATTRSRSDTAGMRKALIDARAATKEARGRLFAARADARDVAAIERINTMATELRKHAYRLLQQERDINWGARWLAESATDAARNNLPHLYDIDGITPLDPRFRRWNGEGQITVQLMGDSGEEDIKGLSVAEILDGGDTRLRIMRNTPLAPRRESPARTRWREGWRWKYVRQTDGTTTRVRIEDPSLVARADRSRAGGTEDLCTLWIRVGSEGNLPVWAQFPMQMHRPLPPRAVIKRATVSRRMRGPRAEWSVEITLDTSLSPRRESCGTGTVAANLGWRAVDDGLRVATWVAGNGERGEIVLTHSVIGAIRKPEDLRETRDRAFNTERDRLVAWLAKPRPLGSPRPAWLEEAAKTLADWRSEARLTALWRRWCAARFDGDVEGFEPLAAWRYHDHHLWCWETSQRVSSLRYRREVYRCAAAALARRFETLIVEDTDYRPIARRTRMESDQPDIADARSNRYLAAPGDLRMILEHAFRVRGGYAERVDAARITMTCHACGSLERFDQVNVMTHTCGACGMHWDQDVNAARNLLARHGERPDGEQETAVSRASKKQAGKWAKRKAAKAMREVEKEGARNPVDKAAE